MITAQEARVKVKDFQNIKKNTTKNWVAAVLVGFEKAILSAAKNGDYEVKVPITIIQSPDSENISVQTKSLITSLKELGYAVIEKPKSSRAEGQNLFYDYVLEISWFVPAKSEDQYLGRNDTMEPE